MAEKAGDLRTALMAVREVRGTLGLTARVTGELVNRTEQPDAEGHPVKITEVMIVKDYGQLSEGRNIIDVVDGQVVSELPALGPGDGV